jgi:hypothetical protein
MWSAAAAGNLSYGSKFEIRGHTDTHRQHADLIKKKESGRTILNVSMTFNIYSWLVVRGKLYTHLVCT